LYLEYNAKLIRRVRWAVRASPEDIEDACAFAWVQFLRRQPDRDRPWRSWLLETAKRQAWRFAAQRGDTLAIVDVDDPGLGTTVEPADPRDRTEQALEFQAALQELAQLPERLQAVVFIRSQSSTQAQVAEVLGVSPPAHRPALESGEPQAA
jgi:DNA-directed RNA polymerase specialized sigma24 family protein